MTIDLDKMEREWGANSDAGMMDSDVWNRVPALIRELRAARSCVEYLRTHYEITDEVHDSGTGEALAAYDAETKGEP